MKAIVPGSSVENNLLARIEVDCIITAAGLSSRMGEWKMMLPYNQGTILDASIENASRFCRRIILVAGYRSNEIIKRYENRGITIVVNSHYQHGLFSSLQCAAAQVEHDFCFITHGDVPCLSEGIFRQLWQARGDYALFPRYRGRHGHPVLLPATRLRGAITSDAESMREFLLTREHRYLDVEDENILFDIDTPAAYRELIDRYQ